MVVIGYDFGCEHFDYYVDVDELRVAIRPLIIEDFGIDIKNSKQQKLLRFILFYIIGEENSVDYIIIKRYEKQLYEHFKEDTKRMHKSQGGL